MIAINVWMIFSTQSQVYSSVEQIPFAKVGLVLGTSNRNRNGTKNEFFKGRIQMAYELLNAGKIEHIIVSGDNRTRYYNEPQMMRDALIALGVPNDKIMLDTAGYRTIESIRNAQQLFGLTDVIIITQKFHGYRALFISNYYHLNARVMPARRLPLSESGNVRLREFFARIKAFIELYVVR